MPFGLVFFCQGISFSFGCYNVQQLRARYLAEVFEGINQFGNVMSVYRTKIAQLQGFEQVAAVAHEAF